MIKVQLFIENPIQTNTWVLTDDESHEAIIIDLGGGYEDIKEYIDAHCADLKFVLCTHGHFDHIMGIPDMQRKNPDIPVYLSKKDEGMTKKINEMLRHFGMSGNYASVKVAEFIDENTKHLSIGNNKIEVIETPGHTQGGLCFKIHNLLFSGDSLFRREIGRCDLEGGDYKTLINSLKTKIATLPDDTFVYPGHGPVTNIKEEKEYNIYLQE